MKKWIPEHAATPLAVGPLERHLAKAFFMAEFRDLEAEKPSPTVLAGILANLHQSSVSPTGKFGFPVATFKGYVPMNNVWTDSWEEWFTRHFRMDFEQCVRGPDWEIDDELLEQFCTKVIPRLLRPLETGGRTIRPRLYHTDMWHGNVYFDKLTKVPIIFDACCVYGHHESETNLAVNLEPFADVSFVHIGSGVGHVPQPPIWLGCFISEVVYRLDIPITTQGRFRRSGCNICHVSCLG